NAYRFCRDSQHQHHAKAFQLVLTFDRSPSTVLPGIHPFHRSCCNASSKTRNTSHIEERIYACQILNRKEENLDCFSIESSRQQRSQIASKIFDFRNGQKFHQVVDAIAMPSASHSVHKILPCSLISSLIRTSLSYII